MTTTKNKPDADKNQDAASPARVPWKVPEPSKHPMWKRVYMHTDAGGKTYPLISYHRIGRVTFCDVLMKPVRGNNGAMSYGVAVREHGDLEDARIGRLVALNDALSRYQKKYDEWVAKRGSSKKK